MWLLSGDPADGDPSSVLACSESWGFGLLTLHGIIMFIAFGVCLQAGEENFTLRSHLDRMTQALFLNLVHLSCG